MRKYLFIVMLLAFAGAAFGQSAVEKKNGPVITFKTKTHDFGDITQGDKVEYTFHFANTGNEPLIITNVQVTCGCTTPKGWPREPVAPGGEGDITVSFNTQGKSGKQNKPVTVVSNAVNPEGNQISFTANILEKISNPQK